jgi:phosphoglycolate phosphatase-like HAD superfamily hydrolase
MIQSQANNSGIEWLRRPTIPRPISLVVFDFDGTLSWLRHGWPAMMQEVFREHLGPAEGETPGNFDALLEREILSLNGKPTIFQTRRFAEIAQARGRCVPDPEALRAEFQRRLDEAIARRSARIRNGQVQPDEYLLHAARPLLAHLIHRGLTPAILSSTILERVREEAALLGIAPLFGRHIYGGVGDPLKFSKRAVLRRLLAESGIDPSGLLSFGDGPVEIADTRHLGGIAVGVCSDEHVNGSGVCHPHKRSQLIEAGADCVIPDFRDAIPLVDELLGTG